MFNEEEKQKRIELYQLGKSQKEIAKMFNCSQTGIMKIQQFIYLENMINI